MNNPLRIKQFELDAKYIKEHVSSGKLCDVGCSTGEFLRYLKFDGELYGMEINDKARAIAEQIISFDKNIFTEENFFDLVIFRGTIQHVDIPFQMIKSTYRALKPGGMYHFFGNPEFQFITISLKGRSPFFGLAYKFLYSRKKGAG